MVKFHEKYFLESIPFEPVNSAQKRQHSTIFRNIHKIEKKMTSFQINHETEFACK